jgi:hypothetical protein
MTRRAARPTPKVVPGVDPAINPASGRCRGCGELQTRIGTDGNGHVVDVPHPCRCRYWRRRNGVCRACDRPVVGKPRVAVWCDTHREAAIEAALRKHAEKVGNKHQVAYRERHRERCNARARARYQNDPEKRRLNNEYKVEWRRKNREKVRLQKERASLRRYRDPTPEGIRRWRDEVARGVRAPVRAPRNERGDRLCLAEGCTNVARGRAKLCASCKAAGRSGWWPGMPAPYGPGRLPGGPRQERRPRPCCRTCERAITAGGRNSRFHSTRFCNPNWVPGELGSWFALVDGRWEAYRFPRGAVHHDVFRLVPAQGRYLARGRRSPARIYDMLENTFYEAPPRGRWSPSVARRIASAWNAGFATRGTGDQVLRPPHLSRAEIAPFVSHFGLDAPRRAVPFPAEGPRGRGRPPRFEVLGGRRRRAMILDRKTGEILTGLNSWSYADAVKIAEVWRKGAARTATLGLLQCPHPDRVPRGRLELVPYDFSRQPEEVVAELPLFDLAALRHRRPLDPAPGLKVVRPKRWVRDLRVRRDWAA